MKTTPPNFYHVRIFLESHCNFRCIYCNPDAARQEDRILSDRDIKQFLDVCAEAGIRTAHYSGGEPTLRTALPEILSHARERGFIEQSITTNGVIFSRLCERYVAAGLTSANISIDSFDRKVFADLTGRDELESVLSAIDQARKAFGVVKINVVVMDNNVAELPEFLRFSESSDGQIICRFIELQSNQPIFYSPSRIRGHHVGVDDIMQSIRRFGEPFPIVVSGKNPNCAYYGITGSKARFGIIANHSRGYPCGGCRKIRLSPYGDVGVCISAEGENVRNRTKEEMKAAIGRQLTVRDELDRLHPDRKHLSKDYGFWRWGDLNPENASRPIPLTK